MQSNLHRVSESSISAGGEAETVVRSKIKFAVKRCREPESDNESEVDETVVESLPMLANFNADDHRTSEFWHDSPGPENLGLGSTVFLSFDLEIEVPYQKAVDKLISEGKLADALALSDRCLNEGASYELLQLLVENGEENKANFVQQQGYGSQNFVNDSWQYCLRLNDKHLAARLALKYLHKWDLDAAMDILTMCGCHLPQSDPIRDEILKEFPSLRDNNLILTYSAKAIAEDRVSVYSTEGQERLPSVSIAEGWVLSGDPIKDDAVRLTHRYKSSPDVILFKALSSKGASDLCVAQMKNVLSAQQLPLNASMEILGRAYYATETFVQAKWAPLSPPSKMSGENWVANGEESGLVARGERKNGGGGGGGEGNGGLGGLLVAVGGAHRKSRDADDSSSDAGGSGINSSYTDELSELLSQSDIWLGRAELLQSLLGSGIVASLDDIADKESSEHLCDRLNKVERYNMAIYTCKKCKIDSFPVWNAWGHALIRVEHYAQARVKFKQAFQLYKGDPTLAILEIINELEGSPPVDVSAVRSINNTTDGNDIYDGAEFAEERERVNLIVEPEIDEDMSNKETEDVFSGDSKDIIGGEQEELFARSIAVNPKMEEPLQKLVLQDIKKSVLDAIINNDNNQEFAATVKKFGLQIEVHSIFYVIGFIEKKFEVKKTSLLLHNVKYKETSIEEQKNSWTSSFEEEESELIVENGEEKKANFVQHQGYGSQNFVNDNWQYCLRLEDKHLAARLALKYLHKWDLDAAMDIVSMCGCHLPQSDPIRYEVEADCKEDPEGLALTLAGKGAVFAALEVAECLALSLDLRRELQVLKEFPSLRDDNLILTYSARAIVVSSNSPPWEPRTSVMGTRQKQKSRVGASSWSTFSNSLSNLQKVARRAFSWAPRDSGSKSAPKEVYRKRKSSGFAPTERVDRESMSGIQEDRVSVYSTEGQERLPSVSIAEGWVISGDPIKDDTVRLSHRYESSPDVIPFKALLSLCSDELISSKGAIDLCVAQMKNVLSAKQLPLHASMEILGQAYYVTETFAKWAPLSPPSKMSGENWAANGEESGLVAGGDADGSSSDAGSSGINSPYTDELSELLSQSDIWLGCAELLQNLLGSGIVASLDDIADKETSARLRDRLIEDERYSMAIYTCKKSKIYSFPVWNAWGHALIRVEPYAQARVKFKQAFHLYKGDPTPVIPEIINELEGSPLVDVSAVRSMYEHLAKSALTILDDSLSADSHLNVLYMPSTFPRSERSRQSQEVSNPQYSSNSEFDDGPRSNLDNMRYIECINYFKEYARQLMLGFMFRHGHYTDACMSFFPPDGIPLQPLSLPLASPSSSTQRMDPLATDYGTIDELCDLCVGYGAMGILKDIISARVSMTLSQDSAVKSIHSFCTCSYRPLL
ncbi:hypothetical protein QJS10_CPB14g01002 [Acorus calamus]|uniref:Uncharacterized protein n=1 Tax=Acorus calamus TaxID=4465 RepID=A0AAV9DE48_ACOCL|nr:hypothetical protein QJS10_CPB14g01002 [Acorus calamus]